MTKRETTTFWPIPEEPIKYGVTRTGPAWDSEPHVLVVRCEGSDTNCKQAVFRLEHNRDRAELRQCEGDLDADRITADDIERKDRRRYGAPTDGQGTIWQRIWQVAMAPDPDADRTWDLRAQRQADTECRDILYDRGLI